MVQPQATCLTWDVITCRLSGQLKEDRRLAGKTKGGTPVSPCQSGTSTRWSWLVPEMKLEKSRMLSCMVVKVFH